MQSDLIRGDIAGGRILQAAYAAVGAIIPQDLELTKDLLDFGRTILTTSGFPATSK